MNFTLQRPIKNCGLKRLKKRLSVLALASLVHIGEWSRRDGRGRRPSRWFAVKNQNFIYITNSYIKCIYYIVYYFEYNIYIYLYTFFLEIIFFRYFAGILEIVGKNLL